MRVFVSVSDDVSLQVCGGYFTVRVELSSSGLCLAETVEAQKAGGKAACLCPHICLNLNPLETHPTQSYICHFYPTGRHFIPPQPLKGTVHPEINSTYISLSSVDST